MSRVTSPAIRSGLSPGALKSILIGSGILSLIFGLILLVGGISNIGGSVGSEFFHGLAVTMSSVAPVAYILFAVAVLCLAYAYNVRNGYIAGGCLIGLAAARWIFTVQASVEGVLALGIAMGILALVVGIYTNRTVADTAPLMKAPEFALKGGRLILLFGIFSLPGILMQLCSYAGANGAMLVCGFALEGAAALLGGIGGILLFAAFLNVFKSTSTVRRAVAPPKKKTP